MENTYPEFADYPDAEAIDQMVADLWEAVASVPFEAEVLDRRGLGDTLEMSHMHGFSYVRFRPEGMDPFYGYWQPAASQPAPLLVHTPGYGAGIQAHPDLVAQGYNVLHVNPLGYMTPEGTDASKRRNGRWPVFWKTTFSGFEHGYRRWLINVMQAVSWAQEEEAVLPDRLSFFGTSQGGGASLWLGSIYRDEGARCVAADEPFMVHFPAYKVLRPDWSKTGGTFEGFYERVDEAEDPRKIWRRLGLIDALSHVHRLTMPVLLTAGGSDESCPAQTILELFERLPGTKSMIYLDRQAHGQTREFPPLAAAWFRLYA